LTRGQIKYLRSLAARARESAEETKASILRMADDYECVASAPTVTEADRQWIYRLIGTLNREHFDSLK
jgi:hypothetical protein